MQLALLGFALLLGLAIGSLVAWLLVRDPTRVPATAHAQLKQDLATATERLRALEADRETLRAGSERSGATLLDQARQIAALEADRRSLETRLAESTEERAQLRDASGTTQATIMDLQSKLAAAQSNLENMRERLQAQAQFMEDFQKRTKPEFENLANQILEARSKTFTETTEAVLKPLKERLGEFSTKVEASYQTEAKERHALKSEVERLIQLNERMTEETNNLTQALRGDSKVQGDWGEMVLASILESCGLREDHEYTVQQQHENEDGDRLRPDVIIKIPGEKHLIVDSKVSLTAYDAFVRAEDEAVQLQCLSAHLDSIRKHIDELSDKHYAKLKGINSPDFVFMFVPVEPAYLLAMQKDPELSHRAWRKGIAIVTATTLLASLKTVANIWKLEHQSRNAQEIADEASKMYDKFVGFLEDFEKIGTAFRQGQDHYQNALGKLRDGKGSVFRKMEVLRELGAAPTKRIKQELVE